MTDTADLTLSTADLDVEKLLAPWAWLLGKTVYKPILLNKFGDWFLEDEEGGVHRLSIVEGTLETVADTVADFHRLAESPDNVENWFSPDLVHLMTKHGFGLKPGECYWYKLAPILGGQPEPDNMEPMKLAFCQTLAAQIARTNRKS